MAFVQSSRDARPSPGVNVNLSSNNPFRRAASPAAPPRIIPTFNNNVRPTSTNPFLDDYQAPAEFIVPSSGRIGSPLKNLAAPRQPVLIATTAELLNGLTLSEKPPSDRNIQSKTSHPRAGTLPITHRTSRSHDAERHIHSAKHAYTKTKELDIFASPDKSENRRPRRNSEASVTSAKDEDRRRRERRHRDKDGRTPSGKSKKPSAKLDIIDKLDVTGIYGPGLFHHDGPFDACNPHRNRRGAKAAPMQAFPEGSQNNALGGAGPVNKGMDFDKFHGRTAEGFTDFNATTGHADSGFKRPHVPRTQSFDPKDRDYIHGEESMGLGTSTFLEGAPAPRAFHRRESDNESSAFGPSSLQRNKSLAQKLRGISRQRPGFIESGTVASPEARYIPEIGAFASPQSPVYASVGPQSAGGRGRVHELNPFFNGEQSNGGATGIEEKKDATHTRIVELPAEVQHDGGRRGRASTDTERYKGLTRNSTIDVEAEDGRPSTTLGGGLLSRVKSMKGGKRGRAEESVA